ncbi:MAG: hypothetical protein IVW57_07515 [Ktedonobacterales bacterium]|nr:hypothetical protein [Ktedonobacterales bacterium]
MPTTEHRASLPRVLTARPFVRAHSSLAHQLQTTGFELRTVRTWSQLLTLTTPPPDAILIDYDAVGVGADGARAGVSAHRLVTLLARQLSQLPTALIVLTELDFAEIEDLAHVGVHAFISLSFGATGCVDLIRAALTRRRARRLPGTRGACAVVPVLTPSDIHGEMMIAPVEVAMMTPRM